MKIKQIKCPMPHAQAYKVGECVVMKAQEKGKWHMSISHPNCFHLHEIKQ